YRAVSPPRHCEEHGETAFAVAKREAERTNAEPREGEKARHGTLRGYRRSELEVLLQSRDEHRREGPGQRLDPSHGSVRDRGSRTRGSGEGTRAQPEVGRRRREVERLLGLPGRRNSV